LGKRKNLTGQVFGRLTAIERIIPSEGGPKRRRSRYLCQCECGNKITTEGSRLTAGACLSCGCLRFESLRDRNRLRPFEWLFNIFTSASDRRDIPHSLTYEDFLIFTKINSCHYCSFPIEWPEYSRSKGPEREAYYLDRIDNNVGYTPANCVVCCSRCNMGKGDSFSYEEWKHIGKAIRDFREMRAA
jgi:hypothetical protein